MNEKVMTSTEAAAYIAERTGRMSRSRLYTLVQVNRRTHGRQGIPFHQRPGATANGKGALWFVRDELDAWIDSGAR